VQFDLGAEIHHQTRAIGNHSHRDGVGEAAAELRQRNGGHRDDDDDRGQTRQWALVAAPKRSGVTGRQHDLRAVLRCPAGTLRVTYAPSLQGSQSVPQGMPSAPTAYVQSSQRETRMTLSRSRVISSGPPAM
jgi:hypothetical protein